MGKQFVETRKKPRKNTQSGRRERDAGRGRGGLGEREKKGEGKSAKLFR